MATVKIHRFRLYDINTDSYRLSRRWATRDVIEKLGGEFVASPSIEVDAAIVSSDIEGMTIPDYDLFTAGILKQAS
jgi:hypothetical protein